MESSAKSETHDHRESIIYTTYMSCKQVVVTSTLAKRPKITIHFPIIET